MITDFLETKTKKKDLKTALGVVREFKKCENTNEWAAIPFMAWSKLEQLEEFLEHLVNNVPLEEDTIQYIQGGKNAQR